MVSIEIAKALREAGLRWSPTRGDHFVVMDRDMDDDVFVLSDMTIEVHDFPTGPVIGFNGTTEWALDSLDKGDALWLPSEHQLRALLGDAFVRLERSGPAYDVIVSFDGDRRTTRAGDPADAYGLALLERLRAMA
ncbi:MAG: pilus assembly protein CpaE [Actinomycetes bacterium]